MTWWLWLLVGWAGTGLVAFVLLTLITSAAWLGGRVTGKHPAGASSTVPGTTRVSSRGRA